MKAAGVTGMGNNHDLLTTGHRECGALARGVKFVNLDQYLQQSFQGMKEADSVIIAVKAVQDLCPQYQSEVPSGFQRSTTTS